jgi:NAD(P)H-flavin reductase
MEAEWLREGMRLALEAADYTTSAVDDDIGSPYYGNPRHEKLMEEVRYSRRLILTYQLAVWGSILLIGAVRWTRKALREQKRRASLNILETDGVYSSGVLKSATAGGRQTVQDNEESSSSRSSTLHDTISVSVPVKDADERTSLLHGDQKFQGRKSIIPYIRAFLLYQPPAVPLFNKTLPSNGTSIILLAFIGLNAFYTLFHINFTTPELFVLADRSGLVFVANLPILYLISAKNQPLRFLTGYSHEFLNIFHRRLGELLTLLATIHAIGMVVVWYTVLGPYGLTLGQFLSSLEVTLGLTALTAYQLVYLTSLNSFRQKAYEIFLASHVTLQVIGLLFLYLHTPGSRVYVGIALAIFVIDRLVYRIAVKKTTIEATVSVMQDDETVKLSAEVTLLPRKGMSKAFGKSIRYGFRAADHVFASIPSLGWKYTFQAHPLVIASPVPAPSADVAQLDFIVRARERFSLDLLNKARKHDRLKVRLDGPYGSSLARGVLADAEIAILVAGGSGIAVAWPLLHYLVELNRSSEAPGAPSFALRTRKVVLVWVVRKRLHVSWIGQAALDEIEHSNVDVIVPEATEDHGRPALESIVGDLVKRYGRGKRTGVVASGPTSLTRDVRNICAGLVWQGRDVHLGIEKFGW